MLLLIGTAIATSCGSAFAAHAVSQHRSRKLDSSLTDQINEIFPLTTKVLQRFERHVEVHKEADIDPVSSQDIKFVKSFSECSKSLAIYTQRPNPATEKQVWKSLQRFWRHSAREQMYLYNSSGSTKEEYLKAVKVQKNGISEEFLTVTCSMIDTVFSTHIINILNRSIAYSPSLYLFTQRYRNIVATSLAQWEADY